MLKYDVVIVGGGPGGAVAGITLVDCGYRVLLIDRAAFPRVKPCGGGISYRVYKRFGYLSKVLSSVPTNLVQRVVLESPSGLTVEAIDAEPLYAMVRRYEFDAALLQQCKQGGIEVREGCDVTRVNVERDGVVLTTNTGEQIRAELVIGADGVSSAVAVHSGLRRNWPQEKVAIDTTEETPLAQLSTRKDTMYVYYGFEGGYGYAYVFPKPEHVNLGVGYLVSYYRSKIKGPMEQQHELFVDSLKRGGVATGSSDLSNFHSYLLPVGGPLQHISTERILLVGDAAGFVNGFTAEGIYYAMVSGEHAGRAALAALKRRDFSAASLQEYDSACLGEIGQELRKSVSIQKRLLQYPRRIDKIVDLARKNDELRTLFTDFVVGKISYSEFKWRVIPRALPFYISYKAAKLWHKLYQR
jgi:geranylgeranyl reductase family protein